MMQSALNRKSFYHIGAYSNKYIGLLLAVIICIIGITIFQDFLESIRSGYSFYITESLLFKTIWILFIPILALLNSILKNQNSYSLGKITLLIVTPMTIHLLILTLVILCFSVVFYNGRYHIYKILSYTLANDLYKLVTIYTVFVLVHRNFSSNFTDLVTLEHKLAITKIIITSGKNNTVIEVNDIYQITAETPYISIHLEQKKYMHTQSLKSISSQLDSDKFVRIHKSTIVNLDKIVALKSRLNGDYDMHLKNGDEVRLSRNYVKNFRSVFKNAHQVSI